MKRFILLAAVAAIASLCSCRLLDVAQESRHWKNNNSLSDLFDAPDSDQSSPDAFVWLPDGGQNGMAAAVMESVK